MNSGPSFVSLPTRVQVKQAELPVVLTPRKLKFAGEGSTVPSLLKSPRLASRRCRTFCCPGSDLKLTTIQPFRKINQKTAGKISNRRKNHITTFSRLPLVRRCEVRTETGTPRHNIRASTPLTIDAALIGWVECGTRETGRTTIFIKR
jgi:hypothetical protein